MDNLLQVFLLSMTPVGELRLSIPIGIVAFNLNVLSVFLVSVLGNLVPAVFLLLFFKKVSQYLSDRYLFFRKIFGWWENNAKEKHIQKIQKYDMLGLILFVGIPLPLTGAWTGALLATIVNLPLKKSITAILLGIIGAGIIVTTLVVFGVSIEKYLGWPTLVGLLALATLIFVIKNHNRVN